MAGSLGGPEIVVPAGFNDIVDEPRYVLNAAGDRYNAVPRYERSRLGTPLPHQHDVLGRARRRGRGAESGVRRRVGDRAPDSPPDFGPLPAEP